MTKYQNFIGIDVSKAHLDIALVQEANLISNVRITNSVAAINVVRYDVGGFKLLQERIYDRSGLKIKGYVAVQRKLLCLFYTLWENNEEFNPKINQKK